MQLLLLSSHVGKTILSLGKSKGGWGKGGCDLSDTLPSRGSGVYLSSLPWETADASPCPSPTSPLHQPNPRYFGGRAASNLPDTLGSAVGKHWCPVDLAIVPADPLATVWPLTSFSGCFSTHETMSLQASNKVMSGWLSSGRGKSVQTRKKNPTSTHACAHLGETRVGLWIVTLPQNNCRAHRSQTRTRETKDLLFCKETGWCVQRATVQADRTQIQVFPQRGR